MLLGTLLAAVLAGCATAPQPAAGNRPDGPERPALHVVSYNIGDVTGSPADPEEVAAVLAGIGWADVYLFQEIWTHAHLSGLRAEMDAAGAPAYHVEYARGMRQAVFSRYPLSTCRAFVPDSMRWRYGTLRCSLEGWPVAVAGVHLEPIEKRRTEDGFVRMGIVSTLGTILREALLDTPRSHGAREVAAWLSSWPDRATIVGGDFNTVPFTRTIRFMNRRYDDALRGSGDYLAGTYWKVDGGVLPRVDFVFHSGTLDTVDARVVTARAGDHYPVSVMLELR